MKTLTPSVLRDIHAVYELSGTSLTNKYVELFGQVPRFNKQALIRKAIVFRIQELFYDIPRTSSVNAKLNRELKVEKPMAIDSDSISFLPGTSLVREYEGVRHEVVVRDAKTFEYNGCLYRSLSSIAKKITGTQWNGKRFFKVAK